MPNIIDPITPSAAQGVATASANLNAQAERQQRLAELDMEIKQRQAELKSREKLADLDRQARMQEIEAQTAGQLTAEQARAQNEQELQAQREAHDTAMQETLIKAQNEAAKRLQDFQREQDLLQEQMNAANLAGDEEGAKRLAEKLQAISSMKTELGRKMAAASTTAGILAGRLDPVKMASDISTMMAGEAQAQTMSDKLVEEVMPGVLTHFNDETVNGRFTNTVDTYQSFKDFDQSSTFLGGIDARHKNWWNRGSAVPKWSAAGYLTEKLLDEVPVQGDNVAVKKAALKGFIEASAKAAIAQTMASKKVDPNSYSNKAEGTDELGFSYDPTQAKAEQAKAAEMAKQAFADDPKQLDHLLKSIGAHASKQAQTLDMRRAGQTEGAGGKPLEGFAATAADWQRDVLKMVATSAGAGSRYGLTDSTPRLTEQEVKDAVELSVQAMKGGGVTFDELWAKLPPSAKNATWLRDIVQRHYGSVAEAKGMLANDLGLDPKTAGALSMDAFKTEMGNQQQKMQELSDSAEVEKVKAGADTAALKRRKREEALAEFKKGR